MKQSIRLPCCACAAVNKALAAVPLIGAVIELTGLCTQTGYRGQPAQLLFSPGLPFASWERLGSSAGANKAVCYASSGSRDGEKSERKADDVT